MGDPLLVLRERLGKRLRDVETEIADAETALFTAAGAAQAFLETPGKFDSALGLLSDQERSLNDPILEEARDRTVEFGRLETASVFTEMFNIKRSISMATAVIEEGRHIVELRTLLSEGRVDEAMQALLGALQGSVTLGQDYREAQAEAIGMAVRWLVRELDAAAKTDCLSVLAKPEFTYLWLLGPADCARALGSVASSSLLDAPEGASGTASSEPASVSGVPPEGQVPAEPRAQPRTQATFLPSTQIRHLSSTVQRAVVFFAAVCKCLHASFLSDFTLEFYCVTKGSADPCAIAQDACDAILLPAIRQVHAAVSAQVTAFLGSLDLRSFAATETDVASTSASSAILLLRRFLGMLRQSWERLKKMLFEVAKSLAQQGPGQSFRRERPESVAERLFASLGAYDGEISRPVILHLSRILSAFQVLEEAYLGKALGETFSLRAKTSQDSREGEPRPRDAPQDAFSPEGVAVDDVFVVIRRVLERARLLRAELALQLPGDDSNEGRPSDAFSPAACAQALDVFSVRSLRVFLQLVWERFEEFECGGVRASHYAARYLRDLAEVFGRLWQTVERERPVIPDLLAIGAPSAPKSSGSAPSAGEKAAEIVSTTELLVDTDKLLRNSITRADEAFWSEAEALASDLASALSMGITQFCLVADSTLLVAVIRQIFEDGDLSQLLRGDFSEEPLDLDTAEYLERSLADVGTQPWADALLCRLCYLICERSINEILQDPVADPGLIPKVMQSLSALSTYISGLLRRPMRGEFALLSTALNLFICESDEEADQLLRSQEGWSRAVPPRDPPEGYSGSVSLWEAREALWVSEEENSRRHVVEPALGLKIAAKRRRWRQKGASPSEPEEPPRRGVPGVVGTPGESEAPG